MTTTSNLKATNHSALLRKVSHVTQRVLCELLGKDKSNMSRVMAEEQGMKLSEFSELLAACNLKVVEYAPETVTIPVAEYEALVVMANKGTQAMRGALPSRGEVDLPALAVACKVFEYPKSLTRQAG